MVCEGNTPHTIGYSLVDQGFDRRLSVQDRILRVDVEMYKWLHTFYLFAFVKLSIHNDILKRKREYIPFLTFVWRRQHSKITADKSQNYGHIQYILYFRRKFQPT